VAGLSELRRLGPVPRVDASVLPARPTTRFAPSVTGPLHLGHVVNAAWSWGLARALGGRVLLRLEDHDRGRRRPEHESAILDEVDWLGLVPDEPPTEAFRAGASPFRQSDHPERYEEAIERLREAGLVYACDCSRREIQERAGPGASGEPRYDGRCRRRGIEPGPGRGLRVELPDEEVAFVDAIAGVRRQRPSEQCGDLLACDREGNWTYQLCVAVDDLEEGVDLVVRGADLLQSTGRQVLLARLLGRERPPAFAHHPLVGEPPGRKLSKADGDACVSVWRAAGRSPEELIGRAAWLGGLRPIDGPCDAAGLAEAAARLIGT
jgi:glutamyl-tRNA synthetase/glutamyl-Q tRNA(Asp) synthetase